MNVWNPICRVTFAVAAFATTATLFAAVTSIAEPQRQQMQAAIAARHASPQPSETLVAAAPAPRPAPTHTR